MGAQPAGSVCGRRRDKGALWALTWRRLAVLARPKTASWLPAAAGPFPGPLFLQLVGPGPLVGAPTSGGHLVRPVRWHCATSGLGATSWWRAGGRLVGAGEPPHPAGWCAGEPGGPQEFYGSAGAREKEALGRRAARAPLQIGLHLGQAVAARTQLRPEARRTRNADRATRNNEEQRGTQNT